MLEVPLEAARRLVVARAGFRSRRRTATLTELAATVARLGCVQIDAISTVDRSQRLVLAVRTGRVPEGAQDRLLRSGRVFEYWAHEASLIPVADWPYFVARMQDLRHHRWFGPVLDQHPDLVARILATAAEAGPRVVAQLRRCRDRLLELDGGEARARRALDRRASSSSPGAGGWSGCYDLPERVLPRRGARRADARARGAHCATC